MDAAKSIKTLARNAEIQPLKADDKPPSSRQQFFRKVRLALTPHLVNWRAEILTRINRSA
jgi:hypothetical protein